MPKKRRVQIEKNDCCHRAGGKFIKAERLEARGRETSGKEKGRQMDAGDGRLAG